MRAAVVSDVCVRKQSLAPPHKASPSVRCLSFIPPSSTPSWLLDAPLLPSSIYRLHSVRPSISYISLWPHSVRPPRRAGPLFVLYLAFSFPLLLTFFFPLLQFFLAFSSCLPRPLLLKLSLRRPSPPPPPRRHPPRLRQSLPLRPRRPMNPPLLPLVSLSFSADLLISELIVSFGVFRSLRRRR